MTILSPALLLPLLYRALREEIGLAIPSNDKKHLAAQLYKARRESGDKSLDKLIIFQPNGDEVWICKKSVDLDC